MQLTCTCGKPKAVFSTKTIIGSLVSYISEENKNFQPMNANFGIIQPLSQNIRDKQKKYEMYAQRALEEIKDIM